LFIVKVVLVSIGVSLLAVWAKLIPRYPKLRYAVLFKVRAAHVADHRGFYPSWVVLVVLLLVVLWCAVLCTNYIVRRSGVSEDETR